MGRAIPVVSPPANFHRPFRAKSINRQTQKVWVRTSVENAGLNSGRRYAAAKQK